MNVPLHLENPVTASKSRIRFDGEWIEVDSGAALEVRNPADGGLLGTVPDMGAHECRRAIDAANAARLSNGSQRKVSGTMATLSPPSMRTCGSW